MSAKEILRECFLSSCQRTSSNYRWNIFKSEIFAILSKSESLQKERLHNKAVYSAPNCEAFLSATKIKLCSGSIRFFFVFQWIKPLGVKILFCFIKILFSLYTLKNFLID